MHLFVSGVNPFTGEQESDSDVEDPSTIADEIAPYSAPNTPWSVPLHNSFTSLRAKNEYTPGFKYPEGFLEIALSILFNSLSLNLENLKKSGLPNIEELSTIVNNIGTTAIDLDPEDTI